MAYGDNYGDGQLRPLEHKDALNKCRKWQLIVSVNGKPRKRNFPGTQGEARKALKAFKEEVSGNQSGNGGITFKEYSERWLESRRVIGSVSDRTIAKDRSLLKSINVYFGDMVINDATRPDVESLFMEMLMDGKKPNYVRSISVTVSSVFNDAVRDGICVSNPARSARVPKREPTRRRAMSPDQLKSFLSAVDPTDRYEIAYFLCGALGLRRGEALALRWEDVDFDAMTVDIRQSLKNNNVIGSTKTEGSMRLIPMPEFVANALKARLKAQKEELATFGIDADPVYVTESLGEMIRYDGVTYDWRRRRSKLGADGFAIHELRHSFASLMANEHNTPVKVLMSLMGHTNISTTLGVYVHSSRELEESAMRSLEGRFRDVCVPENVLEQSVAE